MTIDTQLDAGNAARLGGDQGDAIEIPMSFAMPMREMPAATRDWMMWLIGGGVVAIVIAFVGLAVTAP